jgi:hypothetical protein
MEDPLPENIDGSKRVTHSVNHHVNWSYVALGVAAIVVITKVASILESSTSDDEEEIEVESAGEQFELVVE